MDNKNRTGILSRLFEMLIGIGLGESFMRASALILSIALIGAVIWLTRSFFAQTPVEAGANAAAAEPTVIVGGIESASQEVDSYGGVPRLAQVHTTIPSRPREEVVKYTVLKGDTIFGIAEKFGLEPQTILWGNYYTLLDNPHSLQPDQELNILPVNGTYHEWQDGEGLNGVAEYYGVTPDDIINYAPNHLDAKTIGDFAHPNIKPGTWLIVPNGQRQFISWSAPLGVTRENPASARVLGPGVCEPVRGGAVGFGTFVWPTDHHFLSGYDYTPSANHWGIDIDGDEGQAVYATDAGVIVYAGWNNYGYGNMIMVDHGNDFQSLYAHLSSINVVCGQSVGQGNLIGLVGSTGRSSGPHLHFEIRGSASHVNPWDVLPPP